MIEGVYFSGYFYLILIRNYISNLSILLPIFKKTRHVLHYSLIVATFTELELGKYFKDYIGLYNKDI